MSRKRVALLIGVSGYQRSGALGSSPWRELHTKQDILALKHVLTTRFGFTVTALTTPAQTTRQAILTALSELTARIHPGDALYLHYSGHGDRDFEQGYESLVPSDWRPRNHPQGEGHLTNRDLAQHFTKLKQKLAGGPFFLTFDCCYSGYLASYTRSGGAAIRGRDQRVVLPSPPKPPAPKPTVAPGESVLGVERGLGRRGFTALYACRYNETAKELERPRAMGALSCGLVEALLALPPDATYRTLFEQIRTRVVSQVDDQHPEAEGDLDQLVFGEQRVSPPPGVPVRLLGGIVQLAAGRLHGVTEGSRYRLYTPGSGKTIASGRVTQLELLQANLALDPPSQLTPALQAALLTARAEELEHAFEPPRFAVDLQPIAGHPAADALRAALEQVSQKKGLLRVAGPKDTAEAILQRTERLPVATRPERPGFVLLQLPGEQVLGLLPDDEPGGKPLPARVVTMVERAVRLYTLRNLEASPIQARKPGLPAPSAALSMRLVPVEVTVRGPRRVVYQRDAPPRSEWISGEHYFRVALTNTSERELQVFILDFRTNGALSVLWPARGQRPRVLAPGETRLATDASGAPALFAVSGKSGTGLLKAIALPKGGDSDELDIQAVIQSAQGETNRAANTHPLGFLFNALNEGKRSPVTLGPSELGIATCEMLIIEKPQGNPKN